MSQFHQEGDQKTAVFVLGKRSKLARQQQLDQEKKEAEAEAEAERQGIPDDVALGSKEHYVEYYDDGTKCDLSGDARSVELQFACSPSNRVGVITSIKEPRSCHYVVTVETSMLCSHPHYMKTEAKALPIVCVEGDQELLQQLRAASSSTTTTTGEEEGREGGKERQEKGKEEKKQRESEREAESEKKQDQERGEGKGKGKQKEGMQKEDRKEKEREATAEAAEDSVDDESTTVVVVEDKEEGEGEDDLRAL